MTPQDLDEILSLIQDVKTKTNTNMRDSIPANIKLATKMWFLTTGDYYTMSFPGFNKQFSVDCFWHG